MSYRWGLGGAFGLAITMASAGSAFAAPSAAAAGQREGKNTRVPGSVRVTVIGSVPRLRYELFQLNADPDVDEPIVSCESQCKLELFPGYYSIGVRDADGTSSTTQLEIEGPGRLLVEPPSSSQRTLGLILGISGIVALGVGGVLFVSGAGDADCAGASSCNDGGNPPSLLTLGILVFGAVATPVGWGMFGNNLTPSVSVRRTDDARRSSHGRFLSF